MSRAGSRDRDCLLQRNRQTGHLFLTCSWPFVQRRRCCTGTQFARRPKNGGFQTQDQHLADRVASINLRKRRQTVTETGFSRDLQQSTGFASFFVCNRSDDADASSSWCSKPCPHQAIPAWGTHIVSIRNHRSCNIPPVSLL